MSSKENNTSVWMISREYAGFAEAGGVKNVVKSLAEAASDYGLEVTVFLPRYGNNTEQLNNCSGEVTIRVGDTTHTVRFFEFLKRDIRFIFIDSEIFTEKRDIYTYCTEEIEDFRKNLIFLPKGKQLCFRVFVFLIEIIKINSEEMIIK